MTTQQENIIELLRYRYLFSYIQSHDQQNQRRREYCEGQFANTSRAEGDAPYGEAPLHHNLQQDLSFTLRWFKRGAAERCWS
jgi:hypothetical protein